MQAELRQVGSHILLGQELLLQGLPRVQASRDAGPDSLQGLLKDHWGLGSFWQKGGYLGYRGGAPKPQEVWLFSCMPQQHPLLSSGYTEDERFTSGRQICWTGWGRARVSLVLPRGLIV